MKKHQEASVSRVKACQSKKDRAGSSWLDLSNQKIETKPLQPNCKVRTKGTLFHSAGIAESVRHVDHARIT
jgi:hypothetical protein